MTVSCRMRLFHVWVVPGPAPPLPHRYGFPREAVTSGLWLRVGSLDYRVHSGPSLCHQHISTIKCPTCFPDLLCPWASHPRTSMTFHSPAGKQGHSHPLRPLLCDQPCHLQGSHSTLPAPASPCSLPAPRSSQRTGGITNLAASPHAALLPFSLLMQCAI